LLSGTLMREKTSAIFQLLSPRLPSVLSVLTGFTQCLMHPYRSGRWC
jgi:hypothetical protein